MMLYGGSVWVVPAFPASSIPGLTKAGASSLSPPAGGSVPPPSALLCPSFFPDIQQPDLHYKEPRSGKQTAPSLPAVWGVSC